MGFVKGRPEHPNDKVYTPVEMVKEILERLPLKPGDMVLDASAGANAFYDNYPDFVKKDRCELDEGINFFDYNNHVD